ncbi:MAG: VWA domain-containing protein [Planctomycetota bacterium]|nr:VWA domain-containing protein [Planctomycetota bacterium]
MIFHQPSIWFLLLLALTPLVWWNWMSRRRRPAMTFSSIEPLRRVGGTWFTALRWIVPMLRTLAIVLLIVCLARPQKTDQEIKRFTEGIAIQLLIDRSSSMLAEDFQLDGARANRLQAVKRVVHNFIMGSDELSGRPDDLIGIIAFAGFPDSICPLTMDHDHTVRTIEEVESALGTNEDFTAIGEAVALGVERLHSLDQQSEQLGRQNVASKIMILLTDGENNGGQIDPITAAQLAATFGIRIYTIGAGTSNAAAPMPYVDNFGRKRMTMVQVSIDEDTLKEIAKITGGQYFRATDTNSLKIIYATIDELEKTEIEERSYVHYSEMAVEGVLLNEWKLPPLLPIVFILLALEMLLANTKFRLVP